MAICAVFVPATAVVDSGIPVKVGLFKAARVVSVGCRWSSLANFVAVPTAAVPATNGAAVARRPVTSVFTNAVVATLVSLSPAAGVGAVGEPVRATEVKSRSFTPLYTLTPSV